MTATTQIPTTEDSQRQHRTRNRSLWTAGLCCTALASALTAVLLWPSPTHRVEVLARDVKASQRITADMLSSTDVPTDVPEVLTGQEITTTGYVATTALPAGQILTATVLTPVPTPPPNTLTVQLPVTELGPVTPVGQRVHIYDPLTRQVVTTNATITAANQTATPQTITVALPPDTPTQDAGTWVITWPRP